MENEEFDQLLRMIRYQGWGGYLLRLGYIDQKTGWGPHLRPVKKEGSEEPIQFGQGENISALH